MKAVLVRVRVLAREAGAVHIGGDSVASMGGCCVDGEDVRHALVNAQTAEVRGPDIYCRGPSKDGVLFVVVVREISGELFVSNVSQ